MKRLILCSLSATIALTTGAIARADMHENASEMTESDAITTEGIISPDSQSPNNRAVPGEGVELSEAMDAEADLVEGIISPDDSSPYNRAVPGEGVSDDDAANGYDEVYEDYRETSTNESVNPAGVSESEPTRGIVAPDDDSPYNRAVPRAGALESSDSVMEMEASEATDGIIVPNSDGPNNRAEVEPTPATVDLDTVDRDAMSPTDGIISPNDDSPNNRVMPGSL